MSATKPLSRRELIQLIEEAQTIYVEYQVNGGRRMLPNESFFTERLKCGGIAVFAPEFFSTELNLVNGLAMNGESLDEDTLIAIENRYFARNTAATIEICPWASERSFQALAARKFSIAFFFNCYACELDKISTDVTGHNHGSEKIVISRATSSSDLDDFVKHSVEAFRGYMFSSELQEAFSRIATICPHTIVYLAKIGDRIAGTSTMTLLQMESGEVVAYSNWTSTLPEHRGKGVAEALGRTQLVDAKERGCRFIYAQSLVGNQSAGVREKTGYKLLYTKPAFVKDPPDPKAHL